MKSRLLIFIALTLTLPVGDWGSPNQGIGVASSTNTTTPVRQIIGAKSDFLLAKIVCPPRGPCYDDGRGSFTGIKIISPPRGSLLNNRPRLSWSAVPGATSYTVRVVYSGGTLWEENVSSTDILYPANRPPIEPDNDYELIVEANEKNGKARFRLLGQANAQLVQAKKQSIRDAKLSADETAIKIAELYKNNDLLTEAIEILKNTVQEGSRSVAVDLMLGDLYRQVELPSLAEAPYKQALDLATTLNDKNGQAEAQVGLGRVNVADENWKEATDWLKAAHASYETVKNLELASQVAQFLGEVYKRSGNRNEAIRWYQQAMAGYLNLGDTQRLNNVKDELKNLNQ